MKVAAETARFQKEAWQETIKYPWTTYSDPDIRRQFKKLSVLGTAALPEDKHEKVRQSTHVTVKLGASASMKKGVSCIVVFRVKVK